MSKLLAEAVRVIFDKSSYLSDFRTLYKNDEYPAESEGVSTDQYFCLRP